MPRHVFKRLFIPWNFVHSPFRTSMLWALLIATIIGIVFRLYPITYNEYLKTMNYAKLMAYIKINDTIHSDIARMAPDLSSLQKKALQNARFQEMLTKEKAKVDFLTMHIAAQLKAIPKHSTYLLEADGYYYLGLTRRLLSQGNLGGPRKADKYFNPFMTAPEGCWCNFDLYPYIGAAFFKFISFFLKKITLEYAASIVSLVLFVIAMAGMFWFLKLLMVDTLSGMLGLLYGAIAPIFIIRSSVGWYDNDPYNIIFPALIIGTVVKSLQARDSKYPFLWLILSGACSGVYALFWRGWMYLPLMISFSLIFVALAGDRAKNGWTKRRWFLGLLAYAVATFFVALLCIGGLAGLKNTLQEYFTLIDSFIQLKPSLWPNIFITIGELIKPGWHKILSSIGGIIVLGVASIGLLRNIIIILMPHKENVYRRTMIFLVVWSMVQIVFALSANRYLLFAVVPVMFLLVSGFSALQESAALLKISAGVRIVIVATFLWSLISYAHIEASQQFPIMNETWLDALDWIAKKTPQDSIVNSWWCPGHFITGVAHRRVTFDGATQNNPGGYWIANALLSNDEKESLGILRMLNTSGNKAYELLTKSGYKTSDAIGLLQDILKRSRKDALTYLETKMPSHKAEQLVSLTHGLGPPTYLLVYDDLISNIIALSYVGNWDFKKMEEYLKSKKRIPSKNSKEYVDFLWSIAGGQPYAEGESFEISRSGNTVVFSNNLSLNLETMSCFLRDTAKNITVVPRSIFYLEKDTLKEKIQPNANFEAAVLLINNGEKFSCVITNKQLAESLVFRMYYLGGKGLRYIKPSVTEENVMSQTKIVVYEVDWQKFLI